MFFFIGGVQPKTVHVDKQPRSCPSCGGMDLFLRRTDQYLSLFFIPLFPVKRGVPYLACDSCGVRMREDGSRWLEVSTEFPKKCRFCGKSLASDYIYCPYCGKTF